VLAFVNSMGGTPEIELPILYRKLHEICEKKGLTIVRNLMGAYITSLEMQGCSITLLKMDDELIELWDAPVKTAGLRWGM
jgi:dihydroxyacetone kinase-like protein